MSTTVAREDVCCGGKASILDCRRCARFRGGDVEVDVADADAAAACAAICIWPRRRMVSKGRVMKRSNTEETKVQTEYVVGVRTGSMCKLERRKSGVEEDISVGRVLWRRVGAIREEGQIQERRLRRQGRIARGDWLIEVSMTLHFISSKRYLQTERRGYLPSSDNVER